MTATLESIDERVGRLLASDPDLMQDPYPLLNELRETAPVRRLGSYVLVSRYAEADTRPAHAGLVQATAPSRRAPLASRTRAVAWARSAPRRSMSSRPWSGA